MIGSLYQTSQEDKLFKLSRIEFSRDKSIAYFTYSHQPKEVGVEQRKGKVVALLVPGLPETIAICVGNWPASVDEQMMADFDRFWMGIGLVDPPEGTK